MKLPRDFSRGITTPGAVTTPGVGPAGSVPNRCELRPAGYACERRNEYVSKHPARREAAYRIPAPPRGGVARDDAPRPRAKGLNCICAKSQAILVYRASQGDRH